MPTEKQLEQWKGEHRRADGIYRDLVNQFLLELNAQQVRPSELDLVTLPGIKDALDQPFLTNHSIIEGMVVNITSLSSFNPEDNNRFIIELESPLYQKILGEAREFTEDYLRKNFFNDLDDNKKLIFFDELANTINNSLTKRGIVYKRFDETERNQLRYPVFFTEENAKEFFVCLHYATLQNAIIEDLIRIHDLPIQVLSFFNFSTSLNVFDGEVEQTPHRIILITDQEGRIIAMMEQSFAARPAEPTTVPQLLTKREIDRVRDEGVRGVIRGGIDNRYTLCHVTVGKDGRITHCQLNPDGESIPVGELQRQLREARERHAQQQGKPNPSIKSPETPNQSSNLLKYKSSRLFS